MRVGINEQNTIMTIFNIFGGEQGFTSGSWAKSICESTIQIDYI